jgi:hypothetical protein
MDKMIYVHVNGVWDNVEKSKVLSLKAAAKRLTFNMIRHLCFYGISPQYSVRLIKCDTIAIIIFVLNHYTSATNISVCFLTHASIEASHSLTDGSWCSSDSRHKGQNKSTHTLMLGLSSLPCSLVINVTLEVDGVPLPMVYTVQIVTGYTPRKRKLDIHPLAFRFATFTQSSLPLYKLLHHRHHKIIFWSGQYKFLWTWWEYIDWGRWFYF